MSNKPRTSIKVELVRDALGGYQIVTQDNQVIENLFVQHWARVDGSVQHVTLDVIYLIKQNEGHNW